MAVDKSITKFISESGLLKTIKRSGWWVLGIKNPESVADHSFRCAVIGYVLAKHEGADPYKVLLMTLFNDIHETRISDLHKMAQRYFDYEKGEDKAFSEQMNELSPLVADDLIAGRDEYRKQDTLESLVARDADILECLIQAKEYMEHGYTEAHKFMKKAPDFLKTATAKAVWEEARDNDLNDWWERLSGFKR